MGVKRLSLVKLSRTGCDMLCLKDMVETAHVQDLSRLQICKHAPPIHIRRTTLFDLTLATAVHTTPHIVQPADDFRGYYVGPRW